MYSRCQYKVSVSYSSIPFTDRTIQKHLARPYHTKTPSKTVPFYSTRRDAILLVIRDPNTGRSQVPCGFFLSVYRSCSSQLFLTRPFRSGQSVDCLCSSTRPFRFSPSICFYSSRRLIASFLASFALVHRLFLLARSASVSHLFMLFFASLLASFALVRRLLLLFSLMDLGGVR